MSAPELRTAGDGSLTLGLLPKVSIDPRIKCPYRFSAEFPSPEPPDGQYPIIALELAGKIIAAIWPYRQYVEVIKVGFGFNQFFPTLYITGEVVIVFPVTGQKIVTNEKEDIYLDRDPVRHRESTGATLGRLAQNLSEKARKAVVHEQRVLAHHVNELQRFQAAFADQ